MELEEGKGQQEAKHIQVQDHNKQTQEGEQEERLSPLENWRKSACQTDIEATSGQ